MSELKKCLKCGGKATSCTKEKTHEIFKEHGYEVTIFCEDCGAKVVKWCDMQGLAWGAAEGTWNNRKLVEYVLKQLETLVEKCMINSEKATELGKEYEKHITLNDAKRIAFEQAIEIIKEELM